MTHVPWGVDSQAEIAAALCPGVSSGALLECLVNVTSCQICLEQMTNPKLLPCNHSFCTGCVTSLQPERQKAVPFRCPTCRVTCSRKVESLPTDFKLNSLLEAMEKDRAKHSAFQYPSCTAHNLPQDRYCITCNLPYCAQCVVHRCHKSIGTTEARQTFERDFKPMVTAARNFLAEAKAKRDASQLSFEEAIKRIELHMTSLKKVLALRETKLKEECRRKQEQSVNSCQADIAKCEQIVSSIEFLTQMMDTSRFSWDHVQYFSSLELILKESLQPLMVGAEFDVAEFGVSAKCDIDKFLTMIENEFVKVDVKSSKVVASRFWPVKVEPVTPPGKRTRVAGDSSPVRKVTRLSPMIHCGLRFNPV